MTSQEMSVEEARAKLGDLVINAMRGESTVITRYGQPAATISPYTEEPTDIFVDLDKITRIDARTWAPDDTGIVCERLTLATTEHGEPIVLVEDVRDAEGNYRDLSTVEGTPYTELRIKAIWRYPTIEQARSHREQEMEEAESGEFGGVTDTITY